MKKLSYLLFIIIFFITPNFVAQSNGNIPLHCKTKFNREGGVGDVWGVQINGTNYALITLDGGLSIVNTDNPSSPIETVHINHENYPAGVKLGIPDVETFVYGGITYAYLATNKKNDIPPLFQPFPLVMIININEAIADSGEILIDPYNPSGDVYVGKIDDFGEIKQSHTLTIAGNYLYVATLNDSLPVWNLISSPTNPLYKGFVTLNPSDCAIHEMFVKSTGGNQARVYAASLTGGLQVLELTFSEGPPPKGVQPQITVNSRIEHLYDFDRAYPNQRISGDGLFDYRYTHSAWPTDDEEYIFTTDELAIYFMNPLTQYSDGDPNLYIPPDVLKTPRREGAFLRTWKKSLLGNNSSFKGGFYVSEDYYQGITDLTIIDTNWVPNSIHQMHSKGDYLYVAHYTQGFRMLDISDPENLVEIGFYDDFPLIDFDPSSDLFFRKGGNWHQGINGVFPDKNRPNICYAGGSDGFYIFDVTPPLYAPTNLSVTGSQNNHPLLQWDVRSGAVNYRIYKKLTTEIGYVYLSTTGNVSYEDLTETIPLPGGSGQTHPAHYYVTAVDVTSHESNASNRVSIDVSGAYLDKKGDGKNKETESLEYSLSNSYPNPFNPSTQISYSLAQDADVSVKVYDMLGTEVANLVSETKSAGKYNLSFNAENLASGVYIYRITASKNGSVLFANSKQMILLR